MEVGGKHISWLFAKQGDQVHLLSENEEGKRIGLIAIRRGHMW